jgi:hypothetical protein
MMVAYSPNIADRPARMGIMLHILLYSTILRGSSTLFAVPTYVLQGLNPRRAPNDMEAVNVETNT